MPSETDPHSTSSRGITPWLQWVGFSLVGITALVLLAAHAPPRIRLLGLFAVLTGVVAGWGIGKFAIKFKVPIHGMPPSITVGLLLAGGQVGVTLESWRLDINRKHHEYFVESREDVPAVLWESQRKELERIFARETTFSAYMQSRLTELKKRTDSEDDWSDTAAAAFWLVEVFLGIAAGLFVFRKTAAESEAAAQEKPAGSA